MRLVEPGPQVPQRPARWQGDLRDGHGPLQNTPLQSPTNSKIDHVSPVVYLKIIFKRIYLHGHIHSVCIYKQMCQHCPRFESFRGKARPAWGNWMKLFALRTPCCVLPRCRHHHTSLMPEGRKGITPSVRETVFNIGFGG